MGKSTEYQKKYYAKGNSLPETISSTIKTIKGEYVVDGNTVISPSGKKVTVNGYQELNANNARDKAALQAAKKAGMNDPVRSGNAILPRNIAERAIAQKGQIYKNYRENMQKNVKGYDELTKAISHNSSEYEKYKKSIERGEKIYTQRKIDISALRKKYPRANSYIKAEEYERSSNYVKSALGKEAKQEIRQGKSHTKAIKKMEQKWTEYTRKKALD